MRGKQFETYHLNKKKSVSLDSNTIGHIQGKPQAILNISPRERKMQSKVYLKNISKMPNIGLKTAATQSDSIGIINTEINYINQKIEDFTERTQLKTERFFEYNPNSKFSVHYQRLKNKELSKLNRELFPKEINEEISYVPDYTMSCICNQLPLIETTHSSVYADIKYKTLTNITKSHQKSSSLNINSFLSNKFSTYSAGWKQSYEKTAPKTSRNRLKDSISSLLSLT